LFLVFQISGTIWKWKKFPDHFRTQTVTRNSNGNPYCAQQCGTMHSTSQLRKNGKTLKSMFRNGLQTFFGSKYIKIESVTQPKSDNNFAHFLQNIFGNLQILKFFPLSQYTFL